MNIYNLLVNALAWAITLFWIGGAWVVRFVGVTEWLKKFLIVAFLLPLIVFLDFAQLLQRWLR